MLVPVLLPEPVANLCAAAPASQVAEARAEPVAARLRLTAGDDLDLVAVLDLVGEGHDAAVDLGAAAAMADLGVHVVGEIERRGVRGQFDDVAFRADRVYTVFEHIVTDLVEQVAAVVAGVEQLPQEADLLVESRGRAAAFLVAPVSRNAEFRLPVHIERANLDLQRLALRTNHGRVQGAVVVFFRVRDVVIEFPGQVGPEVVHDPERRVTVLHVLDQDAHRANVEQALEAAVLALHLAPDAVDVFRAAGDLGFDAGGEQLLAQDSLNLFNERLAFLALFLQCMRNLGIGIGLRVAKREVLEFPLELPDAKAICECGVDLTGLGAQRLLVRRGRPLGRTHAMQLFGDANQDQPYVRHDGEQHLAEGLGLLYRQRFAGLPVRRE